MNDPHVTSVVYSVGSGPGIEYDDPPPLIHESALGVFRLSQGRLQVTPTEHFAREEEARSAIEPFLRAWEAETDLVSRTVNHDNIAMGATVRCIHGQPLSCRRVAG